MTITQTLPEQEIEFIRNEVRNNREAYKKLIPMVEAIERLLDNEDFKLVVSTGYFQDELMNNARIVSMNGNEDLVQRAVIRMKGIHAFREFLNNKLIQGKEAKDYLAYSEDDLVTMFVNQTAQQGNE